MTIRSVRLRRSSTFGKTTQHMESRSPIPIRLKTSKQKLTGGATIPKFPPNAEFIHFNIFVDGESAGEISAFKAPSHQGGQSESSTWDLNMMVYERFSGKGVGKEALKEFLTVSDAQPLNDNDPEDLTF